MKHLTDYVYEGLFDVADMDAGQAGTELADGTLLSDKDSEFWRYINGGDPIGGSMKAGFIMQGVSEASDYDLNKKTITIPGPVCVMNGDNPLSNKYDLECEIFFIGQPSGHGPHPGPIKDGAGFSSITVNNSPLRRPINIDGFCKEIEGLKLYVYSENVSSESGKTVINFGDDLKFKNSSITFMTKTGMLVYDMIGDFPKLSGLKSNADIIYLYDASFFDRDNIKNKLNKFFGNGTFSTSSGDVKKTNIRNIVAAANNINKYGTIDPSTIVPVGKVSDLFDLGGFKDLEEIRMSNNNVTITFTKNERKLDMFAKYTRLQGLSKYKDYSLDQMKELCSQCKTSDGWYVIVVKKYY